VVNHPNRPNKDATVPTASAEIAVLVTTAHRGVFFGYVSATAYSGKSIELRAARNCLYWPTENKGFLGLASKGPVKGSRVGPATDLLLHEVTSVARCTPEAVVAWETIPWSR
jgi:hypothetical protein